MRDTLRAATSTQHAALDALVAFNAETISRAAYRDFLALWRDADPDTPVLAEARVEYGRLK